MSVHGLNGHLALIQGQKKVSAITGVLHVPSEQLPVEATLLSQRPPNALSGRSGIGQLSPAVNLCQKTLRAAMIELLQSHRTSMHWLHILLII